MFLPIQQLASIYEGYQSLITNLESDLWPPLDKKYWCFIPLENMCLIPFSSSTFNQNETVIPSVHISGSDTQVPKVVGKSIFWVSKQHTNVLVTNNLQKNDVNRYWFRNEVSNKIINKESYHQPSKLFKSTHGYSSVGQFPSFFIKDKTFPPNVESGMSLAP